VQEISDPFLRGEVERAQALFDAYLPLACHGQQAHIGWAGGAQAHPDEAR